MIDDNRLAEWREFMLSKGWKAEGFESFNDYMDSWGSLPGHYGRVDLVFVEARNSAAFQMFEEGSSVDDVADRIVGIGPVKARVLHQMWDEGLPAPTYGPPNTWWPSRGGSS